MKSMSTESKSREAQDQEGPIYFSFQVIENSHWDIKSLHLYSKCLEMLPSALDRDQIKHRGRSLFHIPAMYSSPIYGCICFAIPAMAVSLSLDLVSWQF